MSHPVFTCDLSPDVLSLGFRKGEIEYDHFCHTTGSGKALIFFKDSTLFKDKLQHREVHHVVDRKALDSQTREEFARLQEGCAEKTVNTCAPIRRLLSEEYANTINLRNALLLNLLSEELSTEQFQNT